LLRLRCALLLPVAFLQPDRAISDVLALHLAHSSNIVVLAHKGYKSEAFRLECALVSDNSSLYERRVLSEGVGENFIRNLVSKVAAEYSEVVVGPLFKSWVLPLLTCCLAHNLLVSFFLVLLGLSLK